MQARCPHCSSVFPVSSPGIQFCPTCGKQIKVPAPTSGESAGVQEPALVTGSTPVPGSVAVPPSNLPPPSPVAPSLRQPTPWERRRELGFFRGYFETWKGAMASDAFWSSVKPDGPVKDALLYAWLTVAVQVVLLAPIQLLQVGLQRPPPE